MSIGSRSTRTAERGAGAAGERRWARLSGCGRRWLEPVTQAARASLLVLTVLLFTSICTLLACRDRGKPAERADFDLLDDPSSLNLNHTSAEPRTPAAPSDSERLIAVTSNFQAAPTAASPQVLELSGF